MSDGTGDEVVRPGSAPGGRGRGWPMRACTIGCLVVVVLAAVAAVGLWRWLSVAQDPDVQWPRLGRVLPYERRPDDIGLQIGIDLDTDLFHLVDRERGLDATLTVFPAEMREEAQRFLDPEAEFPLDFGKPVDPEPGTITVQGREVPCLRFSGLVFPETSGAGVRIDLGEYDGSWRLFELRHREDAPVDAAEVERFLAPFDVWKR